MTDPTPQPLQHAHDDLCADELGGEGVRNIYVRRVGEALDDDGDVVPAVDHAAPNKRAPGKAPVRTSNKRKAK